MTASANPRSWLAPRTSSQECVPSMQNRFKTTFKGIPEQLACSRLMQQLTASIAIGGDTTPKKHLANHQTLFNTHNPRQHHRDRGACGFLLVS